MTWLSILVEVQVINRLDTDNRPVHSKRCQSLALSLLAKPVVLIIHKGSNSICHFHCRIGNSTIIFFSTIQLFSVCEVCISSQSSTVRSVMFTCRVTSLITCTHFQTLFIKKYLTNDTNFALTSSTDTD